jgi:hypothetical protein
MDRWREDSDGLSSRRWQGAILWRLNGVRIRLPSDHLQEGAPSVPVQHLPNRDVSYHLISCDKNGRERSDDRDGLMSERIASAIRNDRITDVFVMSHGWKGDVPAAIEQCDRWIAAMIDCTADREQIRAARPDFKALLVGFHWPSLPFGDEEFGGDASFSVAAESAGAGVVPGVMVTELVDRYADRIADTPRARAALQTIFDQIMNVPPVVPTLPPAMVEAYRTLDEESEMGSAGPAADPGSDREKFDPAVAYANAVSDAGMPYVPFSGFGLSALLSPLQQLSFWKMKHRGQHIGETAGFALLNAFMNAVPNGRDVRFHLMGHSFGCIVVAGMVNGPNSESLLRQRVNSLMLVQGATSLWGYCNDIPEVGGAGYFWPIIQKNKVNGPIVTTASIHDTAVGRLYPLAAGIAGQTSYAPGEFPKYGGIGRFGIQGPGLPITDLFIGSATESYDFQKGRVYNLECSSVINQGGGVSGAHSDIAKPEVAHAMWEAVKVQ